MISSLTRIEQAARRRWVLRGISYLQLLPQREVVRAPDAVGLIGFSSHRGYALVPGPPVAPVGAWDGVVDAFEQSASERSLHVAFCGISELGRAYFRRRGYRMLLVGDEAIVPLPELTLNGARWSESRLALNRARSHGLRFAWVPAAERAGLLPELRSVSDAWLSQKVLPELGFTQSTFAAVSDPAVRLAAARDAAGRVVAFSTWSPMPARNGWMLDLMRFRPGVMSGLMDFVITRSLLGLREEGFDVASLGGVPLSNTGGDRSGWLRWCLDQVFTRMQQPYAPQRLLRYKAKFNPQWEPLYLACAPKGITAMALLAVMGASMPRMTAGVWARGAWSWLHGAGASRAPYRRGSGPQSTGRP